MSKSSQQSPFEEKARAMVEGFRGITLASTPLVFHGETMIPAQVITRLHEITGTFEAVREHEGKHRAAIEASAKGMKDFRSFYEEAVIVVKSHFGSDAKKLATFGIVSAKKGHPVSRTERRIPREEVVETVVEEAIPAPEPIVVEVEVEEVIDPAPSPHREPRKRREASKPAMGPPPAMKPAKVKAKRKGGRR